MRDMHGNLKKIDSIEHESLTVVSNDDLRIVRDRSLYERRFKRPLDIVATSALLVVTLPISLSLAVAVRAGLGNGIFYRQDRIGLGGEPFTILKFRTMRHDRRRSEVGELSMAPVQQDRRSEHKGDDDPRHTGLGRLLRRLSLDELPQLLNVLRGEMSLVGPRPELIGVASARGYKDHVRHDVRPGMTGPYQVSELRLNGDLRDGLELDEEYVNNLSFRNDLRYLVRTIGVMLGGSSGR